MEIVQNETMCNTKSSTSVSYNDETENNELSKDKEEELLFGAEEDGDDEDTLSDDSLRLRLSDDEDAELDEHITNCTNTSEFKLQSKKTEQLPKGVIAEEKSHLNSKQTVEKVIKTGNEEVTQKKQNSENSTLPSEECISETKPTSNNVHNLENSSIDVTPSEFNENSLNMCDKIKDDKESPKDKNTVEVEILNNDLEKENNEINHISKSDKNLEINEINNVCINAVSEQHILENDNLSTNNSVKLSNYQNAETHNEDHLKEEVSRYSDINSKNTSQLNNLDIVDNNNSFVDSVKVKIGNSETSSTTTTVSNNCVNNLTILNHKSSELQVVASGTSLKRPLAEINHNQNSMDTIKFNTFEDNPTTQKDFSEHRSKKKNVEHEDTAQNINSQSLQQEINITLVHNPNDSSNIKDKTEIINEDNDINKSVNQVIKNNSMSTTDTLLAPINVEDTNNENETKNTGTIIQKRKRLKKSAKLDSAVQDCLTEEDTQEEKERGRQKRRTARNAEEIIRKRYLNSESDSSDNEEEFVTVTNKLNQNRRSASPSSVKRHYPDSEKLVNGVVKKIKMSTKSDEKTDAGDITKLGFVEKFFQRDVKNKLQKFTQEELEELLIQKIVETITMRSEIGKLREQARISEKNQEATRAKLQQLIKHVKDFEMILSRNALDRRTNSEKLVAPAKLYRSVGLQVSLMVEQGMQNLRQIQQTSKSANVSNNISSSVSEPNTTNPRRGIKIRSPRRSEIPITVSTSSSSATVSQSTIQTAPLISTVTPAALVVAKPLESQHTLTLSSQSSGVQQLLSAPQQQIQPPQAIVLNGKIQNQVNRPNTTLIAAKSKKNDLIDLTDEEEKSKSNIKVTTVPPNSLFEQQLAGTTKSAQCFQRVIQTIPANVAITAQPANLRLVQPNQPTPTALVNNITTQPRLAYVMQGGVGTRQVIITSTANQIRPVTTCRPSLSPITYKAGISTVANGTVRVLTTPASNVQISKHPAPLPDTPSYTMTPGWKLPPPAPSLKISKVSNGIVLSWNMNLSEKYADIASYQLYAYQEVVGVNPSTSLWKKVGDVRALPLPMACTLTQFSEGNNYYFAVRAVDAHSRKGQYSIPGNISL